MCSQCKWTAPLSHRCFQLAVGTQLLEQPSCRCGIEQYASDSHTGGSDEPHVSQAAGACLTEAQNLLGIVEPLTSHA